MTQTERQAFHQQLYWLVLSCPEMMQHYNNGWNDAAQLSRISASTPLRRMQLKRAGSPQNLAYRMGWNDGLDSNIGGDDALEAELRPE